MMEDKEKGGYTAEGRKLRPRRPRVSDRVYGSDGQQNSSYENGNNYSERRSYSPRNNYQDRQGGYGSQRRNNYGEGGYGNQGGNYQPRPRRSYGDSSYGNNDQRRNNYGDGGYGNQGGNYQPRPRRSYGDSSYGNRGYGNDSGEGGSSYGGGRPQRRSNFQGGNQRGSYGGGYGSQRKPSGRGPARPQNNPRPKKKFDPSQEGINRMLARKPQVEDLQYSDFDNAPTTIAETVRLNKFIANSGVCSRREADQYIQAGVVTVNGEVVTELGTKVNVLKDEVKFNGETIRGEEKVYIVMNKPKGYVTTASDPHAEKTVMDLLKGCKSRVFPVGRLDKNTTGVLMFTNDGEIAERLTILLMTRRRFTR